ncbi:MAG: hypothetical protein NTY07_11010 [Bacteroidia bacterium]|nr:hypothetical protein [Bacteroidia bacterium]
MKLIIQLILILIFSLNVFSQGKVNQVKKKIDRKAVIERHKIITTVTNPKSPAQVGNGEFAFGVDITGLQTFVPFNTLSHWSWHSFPLPEGLRVEDFKGLTKDTHGRMVRYNIANKEQPELSSWLAGNPHCYNLGRIGFLLLKSDRTKATIKDLKNTRQEVDLWNGIILSYFMLEGKQVTVKTACHPVSDVIGVSVKSDLIKNGQVKVFLDFPYADPNNRTDYVGDYNKKDAHSSVIESRSANSAVIARKMDDVNYFVSLNWNSKCRILSGDTISSRHLFYLDPVQTDKIDFTCTFSIKKSNQPLPTPDEVFAESSKAWPEYWKSGAAIDLSQSKDVRWKELERRIVLSQYLMKVNEAGSYPPQESGLVNNGWYGRFHFEMIWWHGVHYALWNRWHLFDKSLHVYKDFLSTSEQRAAAQEYTGARWPKCTANSDREWPHPIHAMLIWQQPHPIYFAELDYRLHPTKETLEKWRDIVFGSAAFMADFAFYEKANNRYILGPPVYIMSENTKPETTNNPAFELSYWRFGLRTAQLWKERLKMSRNPKWDEVLKKLSPLPIEDGLYITHENISSMWTKFTFEHPGLIGTYGMLPGDGVNIASFKKTLDKVISTWNFDRTWGWDFPMMAMAAARTGNPKLAVDMLLHSSKGFQFDEHGLATGGPFPYFPSNGGLLTAVAMMAAGWDGSEINAPGFPKDGNWVVNYENFNRMP